MMTQEEARELHISLMTLMGIFHKKFLIHFRKNSNFPPEVKKNLMKILNILNFVDQLTCTELGRILDIEKGSLTTMIDQLEGLGYVNRTAAPNDRRKIFLTISETGRELMDKTMEQYTRSLVEMYGETAPEAYQEFCGHLRAVTAFMKGL